MGNYKILTNRVKIHSDIRRAVKHFTFGLIPLTNRDNGIFQFRKKKKTGAKTKIGLFLFTKAATSLDKFH